MVCSQQNVVMQQIGEGDVRRVSLLGVDQNVSSLSCRLRAVEKLANRNSAPAIVEAAPAGDAVKVAGGFDFRQLVEFIPTKLEWIGN